MILIENKSSMENIKQYQGLIIKKIIRSLKTIIMMRK